MIETLPQTPVRDQLELDFQIMLGSALLVTRGSAAREVEQIYDRAWELARQVEGSPQLFPALWGLWMFYLNLGQMPVALEVARQLLDLATADEDEEQLLEARRALGTTLFHIGDFTPACEHSEVAIAIYDHRRHRRRNETPSTHRPGVIPPSLVASIS